LLHGKEEINEHLRKRKSASCQGKKKFFIFGWHNVLEKMIFWNCIFWLTFLGEFIAAYAAQSNFTLHGD